MTEELRTVTPEFIAELQRQQNIKEGKIKAQPVAFAQMDDYPQKFSLYSGQRLTDMVDSIKNYGILEPLILLRKSDNRYLILSGRNRRHAAELAGLTKAPSVILENLSEEEAELIVSESNLRQRSFSDMKYSERAYSLYEHYKAIKKQGKRNDLIEQIEKAEFADSEAENPTCAANGIREKNRDFIAEKYSLSHSAVAEYLRVSTIHDDLMNMLDDGKIAFKAAYQLAFVSDDEHQQLIATVARDTGYKINPANAAAIRALWEKRKGITEKEIKEILEGKQQKVKSAVIKPKIIAKYFPAGTSTKDIISKIIDLLEADAARKDGE